ncbi:MAG: F0F1 ATP synthase subunit delta [Patescibacteria group bacterium]|nr:F0F1 ATP synthase subunit delta [Patescibacteria group bacterium]
MKLDPRIKQELRKAYAGIREHGGMVEIISAYALSDQEKQKLETQFKFLKGAQVSYQTDPDLLAGVVIKYGSKMIDLSLRNELLNLKHFVYERL